MYTTGLVRIPKVEQGLVLGCLVRAYMVSVLCTGGRSWGRRSQIAELKQKETTQVPVAAVLCRYGQGGDGLWMGDFLRVQSSAQQRRARGGGAGTFCFVFCTMITFHLTMQGRGGGLNTVGLVWFDVMFGRVLRPPPSPPSLRSLDDTVRQRDPSIHPGHKQASKQGNKGLKVGPTNGGVMLPNVSTRDRHG
ncbi:hypothetical protein LZ30DRAFT_21160 [Colletotrichum cereale]|nr:hypothetical protein LZ30DRAFT_21160 [Colletotrichum cereale]